MGIQHLNHYAIAPKKTKTHRKQTFATQKSVLKNAIKLYDERTDIINAFVNNHIYAGDVEKDMYYQSEGSKPEFEESTAE